ncbi:hypothetical protein GQ55_6G245500 [Panicum hallii var. hallii]|uniref:Uncharacterized protein n=1 Tax=Panicum hallii var. hallii TaxID=1504633 RepID=A0A2T7D956_9POAL|nr:hypothetical protein GQ55_6G245500 [Panicum hallii var. hallii]
MGSRASPPHDYLHMHVEQLRRRHQSLSELQTYARDEDAKLETTRARLSNILKRHEDLKERLSRSFAMYCNSKILVSSFKLRAYCKLQVSVHTDRGTSC